MAEEKEEVKPEIATSEEKDKIAFTKVNAFFQLGGRVHITLRNSKYEFFNGEIVEIMADFFLFQEDKLGRVMVFYNEVEFIEAYRSKEVMGK